MREEAGKAKLIEKSFLERLPLDWDSKRSNIEPDVELVVLESLQPHRYLEELCIRGYGGPSCPTWLGDKITVEALQSLHLDGVSWQCIPSLGRMWSLEKLILKHIATMKEFVIEESFCRLMRLELVGLGSFEKWVPSHDARVFPLLHVLIIKDCPKLFELPFSNPNQDWNTDWFPTLQELEIKKCPKLLLVAHIPWTETLRRININNVKLLEKFIYNSESSDLDISGKDDLQSLDQVLAFNSLTSLKNLILKKRPPLQLKHLLMLTSLKKLGVKSLDGLVGPLQGDDDVEWHHLIECLEVEELNGASGKELTELLSHLPRLSKLTISMCKYITNLAAGVDMKQYTTSATAVSLEEKEEKEDGLLLFPANLCDSLRELVITFCPELVLFDGPSTFFPATATARGGWLQALRSLQKLEVESNSKFLSSVGSLSCCLFPSSLQELTLRDVKGMGTLERLSNLTSLTRLNLYDCGEDLRCKGLGPLLTAGGQLRKLIVYNCPKFFAGWDSNPRLKEGKTPWDSVVCNKLQELYTDDAMGLLAAAPLCSLLSSSLTELHLDGEYDEMERFSKEQEDALHLLASLQNLELWLFKKLQHLPARLHKLTSLKQLMVYSSCPAVRSLPKDGLPKSLQELHVRLCDNEELIQHCRGLLGTIPKIIR